MRYIKNVYGYILRICQVDGNEAYIASLLAFKNVTYTLQVTVNTAVISLRWVLPHKS